MRRFAPRLAARILSLTCVLAGAIAVAGPATAAVSRPQKLATLSAFTQPSLASYNQWNDARQDQSAWADYEFDWSTDHCSASPDNPLGFDFRLSCHRHDFGYRNYKAMSAFDANKARLDDAFYEDMKRACASYGLAVRPACLSLAWTYYTAVQIFGTPRTTRVDLDRASALLP